MKNYGRTSVHAFLGDLFVYRNLVPLDSRLPGLEAVWKQLDLPSWHLFETLVLSHLWVGSGLQ